MGGAQLAVDVTLVSALDTNGAPRRDRSGVTGTALRAARKAKERAYPELLRSPQCLLVVLALEVASRWTPEATRFVRLLARCKARAVPPALRSPATAAFTYRWASVLAFAAARAFASSLLVGHMPGTVNVDGPAPELSDVLAAQPASVLGLFHFSAVWLEGAATRVCREAGATVATKWGIKRETYAHENREDKPISAAMPAIKANIKSSIGLWKLCMSMQVAQILLSEQQLLKQLFWRRNLQQLKCNMNRFGDSLVLVGACNM